MKQLLIIIASFVLVGCGPDIEIWTAAKKGNAQAVKQHISYGTDINSSNLKSWTPLHYASSRGHSEIVNILLENGAYVNSSIIIGTNKDKTPLDFAIQNNNQSAIKVLRKHGAKTGDELKVEDR